jgi:hypothetical protein
VIDRLNLKSQLALSGLVVFKACQVMLERLTPADSLRIFEVHGPGDTELLGTTWRNVQALANHLTSWTIASQYDISDSEHPGRVDVTFKRFN